MVGMNPAMPRKDYEAIIFDCDGTLTDSMPVHFVAWHQTMSRYGIQFPEDRFYALGGMPSDKIVRLLAAEQGVTIDAAQAAVEKEGAFLELLHLLEPIVPVLAVAEHYRHKLPIVVASGGFREVIQKQLNQIGCGDWFDDLVAAEDTERHKPEPDVFLEAARRVGATPKHCLVYEDSDLGITAAKAAGMDYIDVRTFFSPKRIPL
jgi:beta-phosphoglucomutase-like phosphatase (HAD superfamily)